MSTYRITFLFVVGALVTTPGVGESESTAILDDVLVEALRDEMDRSLRELQLDNESKPYFIAYSVTEESTVDATYVLGAHTQSTETRNRFLTVSVRVGSPNLDNSNYVSGSDRLSDIGSYEVGIRHQLPLSNDYYELRREIWLATDAAYKKAIGEFTGKSAALASRRDSQRPKDFSSEDQFVYTSPIKHSVSGLEEVSAIAKGLSATFGAYPPLLNSSTRVTSIATKRLYIDSGENFNRYESGICSAISQASIRTPSGLQIPLSTSSYARDCNDLREITTLKSEVASMAKQLLTLQSAEVLDFYDGPVLVEGPAAAQFFGQALVGRLGATPKSVTEDTTGFGIGAMLVEAATDNPFVDRLNTMVFPAFLSVVNDPTITEHNNSPLLGSYVVDEEGMPARRTELITNGMLKRLLTTRAPTNEFQQTTGSARGLGGPRPGNLFIDSVDGVSMAELRSTLMGMVEENGQEFALLVRQIMSVNDIPFADPESVISPLVALMGDETGSLPTAIAYKVFPDGREVPVLPLVVADFSDRIYREIVAVSDQRWKRDLYLAETAIAEHGLQTAKPGELAEQKAGFQTFVSIVSPALVFEEVAFKSANIVDTPSPVFSPPVPVER